ncbi:MAG: efflux RND transporter periplasmic adaptor subunit [Mesorhizobium sp.]|nr:efflux RND transporter periplasmic adaptor subunit [Mesorhizobium sp.]
MYRLSSYFLATTALLGALAFAEPVALAEAVATATEAPQSAPAIRVAAVTRHELIETLDVTGSIVPRQEAAVGVDVAGLIVRQLNADKGDVVKKGDVLALLDRTALETQLVQLDASKAQAEAAIAQAKAQVSGAEVGVRQATETLDRARALQQKGVAAQSQLDNAVNGLDSAQAQLDSAAKAVASAEAQLGVIGAQRRDVEERLAKTEVRAPADGVVLARNATLGGIVSASGGPLFRIAMNGELELAATVSETSLAKLRTGMPVKVNVAGVDPLDAQIRFIDPEIDARTRLGTVRIRLPAHDSVRSGNFARGTIETLRREGLAVPASALLYKGTEAFVQKVVDGTIRTTPVTAGARAGAEVEVTGGLAEGDEVVSRAGTFVTDGDKVTPVRDIATGAVAK